MSLGLYILRDRVPVRCPSMRAWSQWFEGADALRRVAETMITQPEHDPVRVSTVFLGLDHSGGVGPPQLFETMVFGGPLDEEQYRYATWAQAEAGHTMLCDEAVLEGKVSAWEVRERLKTLQRGPA